MIIAPGVTQFLSVCTYLTNGVGYNWGCSNPPIPCGFVRAVLRLSREECLNGHRTRPAVQHMLNSYALCGRRSRPAVIPSTKAVGAILGTSVYGTLQTNRTKPINHAHRTKRRCAECRASFKLNWQYNRKPQQICLADTMHCILCFYFISTVFRRQSVISAFSLLVCVVF